MSKPITPDEAVAQKQGATPPEVFEAFNACIARHFDGNFARFTMAEAVGELKAHLPAELHAEIYRRRWLDVEPVYRAAGWRVKYDRPGYNESYEAAFEFWRR